MIDNKKKLTFVFLASLLWGVGRFVAKIGVTSIGPWMSSFIRSLVFLPVVTFFVFLTGGIDLRWNRGTLYAAIAGILVGGTIILFRVAYSFFEVSFVDPILRLNILVTGGIGVLLLGEKLTYRKIAGLVSSLMALFFLTR